MQALLEHARVVDGQVRVAGVELALHAKDAGLHEGRQLVGKHRQPVVTQGVALPKRRDVADGLLVLLGHVEHVTVAPLEEVELVEHEAERVLGEDRRVAVLGRLVADDQCLVLDVDGHVVEDVGKAEGPAHDGRLVGRLTVGLSAQYGTLRVYEGSLVEHLLSEGLHALGEGPEVLAVLHECNPFSLGTMFAFVRKSF